MQETYDIEQAAQAQADYCERHGVPMFAPMNGYCDHCCRNIYEAHTYRREPVRTYGISVEEAGKRLITGCPHCGHTFCD